jgi:hypothetical protein
MIQALRSLLAMELRLNLFAHQFVPQNLPEKMAVKAAERGSGRVARIIISDTYEMTAVG